MKLELVKRRDVSFVELQRDKKHSLGLTIRDGTEEDTRPVIKSIKINSPAAKSFALAKGDVVLSVNGFSTVGSRSKEVRQMLDDAGPNVSLQVLYKTLETRVLGASVYKKQRLTLRLQKMKGSFGFLLRKCSKYSFIMEYPIISNIVEGSPIHKRGHLQDGDRLLKIDNISLSWMSLSYIASILQAKDEADFTFEYSVRVVNFSERDTKLDLEIDSPVADLGISFRMCDDECSVMYISNIRQGSVAERCGIFCEGDVILSVNGTDVKNLTVSKAFFLLRNVKKCRKISFISNRRKAETQNENAGFHSTEDTACRESFTSDIPDSDWKHINTPVSGNFTSVGQEKFNFQNFCYVEQIKSMDKFQNLVSVTSSLKQTLSALTRQAFKGTQTSLNQNCTSCNNTKHTVKLCTSCLARMNVKCAQSIDVLRELVVHFIKFSSNMFDENDDQLVNISLKNVIHMLKETLPDTFRIPELQEQLSILAEKIACADSSCDICNREVKTIMLIAKQLLLVLSVRDDSVEFTDIVKHLVCCLLKVDLPCCGDSGYSLNSKIFKKREPPNHNLSETVCVIIEEEIESDIASCHTSNNSETESNHRLSLERDLNTLQVKTGIRHDYLKLTHIQSLSESKNSATPESIDASRKLSESYTDFPKEVEEISINSFMSENLTGSPAKRFLRNPKLNKIWKSLDSLVKPRKVIYDPPQSNNRPIKNEKDTTTVNQNICDSTNLKKEATDLKNRINSTSVNQCKSTISNFETSNLSQSSCHNRKISDSTNTIHQSSRSQAVRGKFSNLEKHADSSNIVASSRKNIPDFIYDSESSVSRCMDDERKSLQTKQTYPETNNLTLKNDGDGFGLVISDKPLINELPVIDAIKRNSPADKEGVLKPGDRILAINGVLTSNLSPRQFRVLKTNALAARTITVRVEFDVWDEKYMFGTFDVVLDYKLNIGLIYEDMKQGAPLVIKAILKGSAAHRSGQVFPRDEITFMKYKAQEKYDPLTGNFTKERTVILTITRDPKKVLGLDREDRDISDIQDIRVPNPTPCPTDLSTGYSNLCFQQEQSMPKTGENFEVKRTVVRPSRKNSLIIEHEVTLYRDFNRFDFGILLGRDTATGRAYVKDIRPDGPAHKSGVIKKNDRILEVNGELVDKNVEYSVLELFSQADDKVDILIRRVYRDEPKTVQTNAKRIY